MTSYQFVKSDALDAPLETSGLYVRNDSDITKVQKDIENIKSSVTNSSKIVDENGEPRGGEAHGIGRRGCAEDWKKGRKNLYSREELNKVCHKEI